MLTVYNPSKGKAISSIGNTTRAEGVQTFILPDPFSENKAEYYVSFLDAGEFVVSDSLYVASVMVLWPNEFLWYHNSYSTISHYLHRHGAHGKLM